MKNIITIIIALLVTVATAWYQRISGPTYPLRVNTVIEGNVLKFKLPRSHVSTSSCDVRIPADNKIVKASIVFKRFPVNEAWDTIPMQKVGNELVGLLPAQPPAGKLQYFLILQGSSETKVLDQNTAIIRFRGDVPAWVMIPHIIFMFLAMLLSNLAGLQAAFKLNRARYYTFATVICMFIGGMIFGPITQKYAFGEFWTGFPFGWDLTDNKTLIALLVWIVAMVLNLRKPRPVWIIIAALVTLLVYGIPHSMMGSELDYSTGTVTTG